VLSGAEVARFVDRVEALFATEGGAAGSEFKQEPGARRLANCVDKGRIFEQVMENPLVLECVEMVLGREFKLSSLNVRSANPHANCGQPLHADSGAIADEKGYWVCNSLWMLDEFTKENGAVRVVPGSHRWRRLPDPGASVEGEKLVTGKAGTVVVMNAHMWHGGTDNRSDKPRRAMHVYFTRRDKPQQQYQKQMVRPEVQARLSAMGRKLLALDDPLNDELGEQGARVSGFLK
jgi:ectoine hydroxylase-related dioxygenase (phytanoyl-CoA dioxygenase family)